MAWRYCNSTTLNLLFGSANVTSLFTFEQDDASVAARIAAYGAVADDMIDAVARHSGYTIPLATAAGATPDVIEYLSAAYTWCLAYEARGNSDSSEERPTHRYRWMRLWIRNTLDQIKDRALALDAEV